jgi:hypothetical protein
MTPTIYEVLAEINSSDAQEETLARYENDSIFIKYLKIILGVDYKFSPDLGEGFPSFTRINRDFPDGISDTSLRSEHRGFYLYEASHELNEKKRVHLFSGMLEGLHYTEADLIVAVKDGKFFDMFPNITYALANKVFPQWFPEQELKEKLVELVRAANHLAKVVDESLVVPETILSPSEHVSTQVDSSVAETIPETIVEPVKLDKRSKAYRESIGRK